MKEYFSGNESNEVFNEESIKECLSNLSLEELDNRIETFKIDPKDRLLNKPKVGIVLTEAEKAFIKKIAKERGQDFKEGFQRMEPYLEFLYKECKEQRILFEFAFIPLIESHFKKGSISENGAKGAWQFTNNTAKDYNLKDPFDIKSSSKAGIKMCKKNYNAIKSLDTKNDSENIFKFATLAYNVGLNKAKALYNFSNGNFPFLISKLQTNEGLTEINKYIKKTNPKRKYKLSTINAAKAIEIPRYVYKIFAARDVIKSSQETVSDDKFNYQVTLGETVYSIFKKFNIKTSDENYNKFKKLNNKNSLTLSIDEKIILPIKTKYLQSGKGLISLIRSNNLNISPEELFKYNKLYNPNFKNILKINSIGIEVPIFIPDNFEGIPQNIPEPEDKVKPQDNIEMEPINQFSGMTYLGIKEKAKSIPKISNKLKGHIFIIDPGHGGRDPGAVPKVKDGNGDIQEISEAPLVYDISLRIMEKLVRNGASVYFTSYSDDIGIYDNKFAINFPTNKKRKYNLTNKSVRGSSDLLQRPKIAKKLDETYGKGRKSTFISIHADSKSPSSKGLEILYGADLEYKAYDKSSKELSDKLAKNIEAVSKTPPFNPKTSGPRQLGVLKHNKNDNAILIEVANMRNVNEAFKLRSSKHREKISERIANGFINVLGKK